MRRQRTVEELPAVAGAAPPDRQVSLVGVNVDIVLNPDRQVWLVGVMVDLVTGVVTSTARSYAVIVG